MSDPSLLLIGASRGLGLALAEEFLARNWRVTGTVRSGRTTPLHDLAKKHPDRLEIETVDIGDADEIAALKARLSGQDFNMLFVNAGVTNNPNETIADVSTEEFTRVMLTNALGVMRTVEALHDLVTPAGTIGVMSSGQGSVANNTGGQREVYRASKAALNTLMRSFAARHASDARPMALMAPGWVRTDMGGSSAPLGVEDSIPKLVNVLLSLQGKPGLQYLDYQGRTVPW